MCLSCVGWKCTTLSILRPKKKRRKERREKKENEKLFQKKNLGTALQILARSLSFLQNKNFKRKMIYL
jgi:hypothetical protein